MQRQQELYEKSKSTYDKASRGGLKVKEPPAAKPGSPAAKAGTSPSKKATAAGTGFLLLAFLQIVVYQ